MLDLLNKHLNLCIAIAKRMPNSRELSLVITKLEEASLWLSMYEVRQDG
jgi:hypothetical protein